MQVESKQPAALIVFTLPEILVPPCSLLLFTAESQNLIPRQSLVNSLLFISKL
jgi:hypothetical protein